MGRLNRIDVLYLYLYISIWILYNMFVPEKNICVRSHAVQCFNFFLFSFTFFSRNKWIGYLFAAGNEMRSTICSHVFGRSLFSQPVEESKFSFPRNRAMMLARYMSALNLWFVIMGYLTHEGTMVFTEWELPVGERQFRRHCDFY